MTRTAFSLEGLQGLPVLVLANSLSASTAMWDDQIDLLSKSFQILRYDYRGHGKTEAYGDRASIDDLASDLLELLDSLHIDRFHFVGLSLGGMLGMHMAASYPARVQSLVATNFRPFQTDETRQQWEQRLALVRAQGVHAIVAGTADRWLTPGFCLAHPQTSARIRAMIASTSREGYLACAQAVRDYDARPLLSRIQCPVELISGAEDVAAPASEMHALCTSLKEVTYTCLPASHLANVECAEQYSQRVLAFLTRHSQS